MKSFQQGIGIILAGICLSFLWKLSPGEEPPHPSWTVAERLQQYGDIVATRLQPDFAKAGVEYPPKKITLVILKQEQLVELYAQGPGADPASYHYICSYPIQAASGNLGPKLHEGDEQVPEGIYAVDSLNPNSHYHLALHVNYPNAFDRAQAKAESRDQLGGDIMIHGSNVSIGCVAMGDTVAEDLFVLTAKTGLPNVTLLFCPFDFRLTKKALAGPDLPRWAPKLYTDLEQALNALPLPPLPPESSH